MEVGVNWRNNSALEVDLARVHASKLRQVLFEGVVSIVEGEVHLGIAGKDISRMLSKYDSFVCLLLHDCARVDLSDTWIIRLEPERLDREEGCRELKFIFCPIKRRWVIKVHVFEY